MQLGFVSAILPDFSFEEVLKTASEIGFDCVEIMCWPVEKVSRRYAGVTHIDVTDFSAEDAAKIRRLQDKYGIQISGLGYYPNPLSPDESESQTALDHLHRIIKAASLLDVDIVNTFIGRDWTKSVDDNFEVFHQKWPALIQSAEDHGVRLGIENCPMLFTEDEWPGGKNLASSPAIWKRMFSEIPSPSFGLNYDPSHPVWLHMDYLQPLIDFSDRLFHIHAKDVRIDQRQLDQVGILGHPNDWHTPKLPGLGDVDWGKFFSVLTDVGYNGPVCVEVEDRAYETCLEDRLQALRQSHTFLRNFVPKAL
ncbi:MAG: sugar phosphate isomerase/epimerase family protein [Fuerstiella sp.]